ncbi:MAG: hypothetical protein ACI9TY_000768 [Alphaproteobacteria bacterium]|jgi:hypothetical protein
MRPLASLSQKILRKPAKIRGFAEFSVLEKWVEIFPSYAPFMRPMSLKRGILKVATNSGSAATNLRMQGPYLIARINQYFGYNAVKEIKYIIRDFDSNYPTSLPQLVEDEESLAYAQQSCETIKDTSLKESFQRLAAMVYAEKKLRK